MMMKKPRIEFNSSGESGNIFWVLSKVRDVLRKQQRITEYNDLRDQVLNSKSYAEALAYIREKVDLVDLDGKI